MSRAVLCCALLAAVAPLVFADEDEVMSLAKRFDVPARFADTVPVFAVEPRTYTFHGPKGPFEQTLHMITDRGRLVAIYSARPQIDLITHDPDLATPLNAWTPPVRYHNARLSGTRITTIPWMEQWSANGDEHDFRFEVAPDQRSITLAEWQKWKPGNKLGRAGESEHRFTLRIDPVLGYVIDIDCRFKTDKLPAKGGKAIKGFEFSNMLDPRMSSVWPERTRWERTVYTPGGSDRFSDKPFAGWVNNTWAGERSDSPTPVTRAGGFVGFIDRNTRSPALSTWSKTAQSLQTCNVWQDQHNHLDFPAAPDVDGLYRMNWRARFQYLPPAVVDHLFDTMHVNDFDGAKQVLIRFGRPETFDDQPIALTDPTRGLSGHGLRVEADTGRDGSKALVVQGGDDEKSEKSHYKNRGPFLFLPQIELEADTRYEIEAWVRIVGEQTSAQITADQYEWTPHDPARTARLQTNTVATPDTWQKLHLQFTTPKWDANVDLRFMVVGPGKAYFDDFRFQKVTDR